MHLVAANRARKIRRKKQFGDTADSHPLGGNLSRLVLFPAGPASQVEHDGIHEVGGYPNRWVDRGKRELVRP